MAKFEYPSLMKLVPYIFVLSLFFTACQQSRLLNLRNLTLVKGDSNEAYVAPQNGQIRTIELDQEPTYADPQTVSENTSKSEFNIDWNDSKETTLDSNEDDFKTEFIVLPNEIIDPNNIDNPTILSDSTKTESKKPSKKVSGKILWVFGGLSLIALILLGIAVAFGLFFIILFLWIVFGHFFE